MLAHPERFFEDRFGLTSSTMERLLGSALARRVDHADLYLEYRVSEELTLEEGAVKKASRHVSQGAGVRAQSGERTGYAHTDDLSLPNLEEAARQARAIADQAGVSAGGALGFRGLGEGRGGEEGRSRGGPDHLKKKKKRKRSAA